MWFQGIENKTGLQLSYPMAQSLLLAWIPAQFIWYLVQFVHPGPSMDSTFLRTPFRAFALLIVIAPVLETYGMRLLFALAGRVFNSEMQINVVSAVIWGVMHWQSESWGLHAFWAFFVMGQWFLCMRKRSIQHALYTTMIIHALFNALSYSLFLITG